MHPVLVDRIQHYTRHGYYVTSETEVSAAVEKAHPLGTDEAIYLRVVGDQVREWPRYRVAYETDSSVSLVRPGLFQDGGGLYLRFEGDHVIGPGWSLAARDVLRRRGILARHGLGDADIEVQQRTAPPLAQEDVALERRPRRIVPPSHVPAVAVGARPEGLLTPVRLGGRIDTS